MNIDERLNAIIDELIEGRIPLKQAGEAFEKKYLVVALNRSRQNVTKAAALLGVHRNTLHNKLRLIDPQRSRR